MLHKNLQCFTFQQNFLNSTYESYTRKKFGVRTLQNSFYIHQNAGLRSIFQLLFLLKDLDYKYFIKQNLTEYLHTCTMHVDSIFLHLSNYCTQTIIKLLNI